MNSDQPAPFATVRDHRRPPRGRGRVPPQTGNPSRRGPPDKRRRVQRARRGLSPSTSAAIRWWVRRPWAGDSHNLRLRSSPRRVSRTPVLCEKDSRRHYLLSLPHTRSIALPHLVYGLHQIREWDATVASSALDASHEAALTGHFSAFRVTAIPTRVPDAALSTSRPSTPICPRT